MREWTEKLLESEGYKVENAQITNVDLSMQDHGCLTLEIVLKGSGWGCCYGGYVLAKGFVGADDDFFSGSAKGMESIARIMDVVGCDCFNDMKNKFIRVATKGWGSTVDIIGNIVEEKWFDAKSFFTEGGENEGF